MKRKIETEKSAAGTFTWYIVKGDYGAVQFLVLYVTSPPMWVPLDLGVHSETPLFVGHSPHHNCAVLDGDDCYCAPSFDMARDLWDRVERVDLRTHPIEAIWGRLESIYEALYLPPEVFEPGIYDPPLVKLPWAPEEVQKSLEAQQALVQSTLERVKAHAREAELETKRRECSACANLERHYTGDYICFRCREDEDREQSV